MIKGETMLLYAASITLISAVGIIAVGTDDGLCGIRAQNSEFTFLDRSFPGLVVLKVPYRWCTAFCSGWSRFHSSEIELVLLQFILPTVIFALVIPRKWHLDLAPVNFDFHQGLLTGLIKALPSLLATGIVASCDMILWIGVILALAGPMIFSGVVEMYLDIISIHTLATSHSGQYRHLTAEERLGILIAVLCGNFEGDQQMVVNLRTTLSTYYPPNPLTPNIPTVEVRKAQLESIMNGQASFGSVVGIPALFFLAGLLYNAFQIADDTAKGINWTPYAIWLMTMVFVVLISAAQLTGNNPSVATMLIKTNHHLQDRQWWSIVANYFNEELSPAPMYDRAVTKIGWIRSSTAYQNRNWFRNKMELGVWMWSLLVLITGFTTFFASILAYSIAHNVPWPREGCRSFSYLLYIALQAFLVLLRLVSCINCQPLFSVPAYNPPVNVWLKFWQFLYCTLGGLSFAVAFFLCFAGSIFQIFGVYNNCFCRTPVSSWGSPNNQKVVQVTALINAQRELKNKHYADNITLAAVLVTGILCYFGWWYQKVMRRAVAVELNRL